MPHERSETDGSLTQAQLARLADPDTPLTRRELRVRERAVARGQLKIVDGEYQPTPFEEANQVSAVHDAVESASQLHPVTSADVLAGTVSASTGMTRRQLRELAQRHSTQDQAKSSDDDSVLPPPASPADSRGPAEPPHVEVDEVDAADEPAEPAAILGEATSSEPSATAGEDPSATAGEDLSDGVDADASDAAEAGPPRRVSAKLVAAELDADPASMALPEQEAPAETTARRPIVRPVGASTSEHTGQFDPIQRAMRDINAAPVDPNQRPQRASVYEAVVPSGLQDATVTEEPTSAAHDWSTAVTMPPVTDDVLAQYPSPTINEPTFKAESTEHDPVSLSTPDPEQTQAMMPIAGSRNVESDDVLEVPDWHAVVAMSAIPDEPSAEQVSRTPGWLVALQWLVIVVVAIVLGLLVWYAVTKGFGERETAAGAEVLLNRPRAGNTV